MSEFLRDYQREAVGKMKNGCILNGGVGSGKSRTGLYYYFKENGGSIIDDVYTPMKKSKDLYIITTAMKRNSKEWEQELAYYSIPSDIYPNLKVVIDSWNNIKKYRKVTGAFFIFDEDRVTGSGVWVRVFLDLARKNKWIILSATPGDTWEQYIPVFVANGFYKNKTDFITQHVIYSRFTKYPKIDRYVGTRKLEKLRNDILIDMEFQRRTIQHHETIRVTYDDKKYKWVHRNRWDIFKDEPIQQAAGLCYVLRRIVNSDESRIVALLDILEKHSEIIVFYNFDYERDMLHETLDDYRLNGHRLKVAEWSGHLHQPVPDGKRWVYLVQYTAGCEGWNCTKTDAIVFFSQNYSYKVFIQAAGRIDRMNTPYTDLYYYHMKSYAPIDLAISKAVSEKKDFNEKKFLGW